MVLIKTEVDDDRCTVHIEYAGDQVRDTVFERLTRELTLGGFAEAWSKTTTDTAHSVTLMATEIVVAYIDGRRREELIQMVARHVENVVAAVLAADERHARMR